MEAWIFIAIAALSLYAAANILDKMLKDSYVKGNFGLTLMFVLKNFIFILFLPFINLSSINTLDYGIILLLGVLWLLTVLPYVFAISFEDVSRVVPVWNMYPIFVLLLSALFLHEKLSSASYTAFALLILGGITVSIHFKEAKKMKLSAAFWLMLGSCATFSVYLMLLKYLLGRHDFWTVFILVSISGALISSTLLLFKKPRNETVEGFKGLTKKGMLIYLANGAIGYAAILLYNYALAHGNASLVASLEGFQSLFLFLFAIILAYISPGIIKEEITKEAIITKGVGLLLLGAGLFVLQLN